MASAIDLFRALRRFVIRCIGVFYEMDIRMVHILIADSELLLFDILS